MILLYGYNKIMEREVRNDDKGNKDKIISKQGTRNINV